MLYNVEQLRRAQDMSQEELAKKAGVSRTIISYIETGKSDNVKLSTLLKISQALGVPLQDLFFAS